jgi:hypothetical protein
MNTVRRPEHILDNILLRRVEVRMLIGNSGRLPTRKYWSQLFPPIMHSANNLSFFVDSSCCCEQTIWEAWCALDCLKLARHCPALKVGANLQVSDLTHAAAESIADEQAFVYNGLTFKVPVARKSDRLPNARLRTLRRNGTLLIHYSFVRSSNDCSCLVAVVGCQFSMRSHDFRD